MNLKVVIFGIVFSCLTFSLLHSQDKQVVDRIAAIVGNEIILESELNTLILQYSAQANINLNDQTEIDRYRSQFLKNIIDEKLLLIKAEEDTIEADQDRVDQVLDQQVNDLIRRAGSVERLEQVYQAPISRIKKDIKKQIENRFIIDMLRQTRFSNVKISRREVEAFYKQYRDSLPQAQEAVDISHILLQIRPSDESAQEALTKINKVKELLAAGGDFAELAKEYSEGPSAPKGGDIGWVNRTDVVKEYSEASFALEKNAISDIVQTSFGYHIIQLLDRQGERIHTRHILIQLKPTADDEVRVARRLNELRESINKGDITFEEAAVQNSDDPNVASDKGRLGEFTVGSFQVPAFEQTSSSLAEGEVSEPFKTDFGYHILKLHSRETARTLSLEKDWQEIQQFATERKALNEFETWLAEVREAIPIDVKIKI